MALVLHVKSREVDCGRACPQVSSRRRGLIHPLSSMCNHTKLSRIPMKAALWGYCSCGSRGRGLDDAERGLGNINDSLTAQSRSPSPQAAQLPYQSDRSGMRHGAAAHRPRRRLHRRRVGKRDNGAPRMHGAKMVTFSKDLRCTFPGNGTIDRNNTARWTGHAHAAPGRRRSARTGDRSDGSEQGRHGQAVTFTCMVTCRRVSLTADRRDGPAREARGEA